MLNDLKDYFSFSRKDLRGIYVLLFLLTLVLAIRALLPSTLEAEYDFSEFDRMVLAFEKSRRLKEEMKAAKTEKEPPAFERPDREIAEIRLQPFKFDPNHTSEEDWLKMGLSLRQTRNIQNYLASGGSFNKKEDLKRIFTISDEEYEILEPFIHMESLEAVTAEGSSKDGDGEPRSTTAHRKTVSKPKIDINTADSLSLIQVRGIGPVFARRILRYRDLIGGFHSPMQLLEIYGMDSARYNIIHEQFHFDRNALQKLDVNRAEISELTAHPYIDFYLAKSIIDQRIKSGNYVSSDELYGIPLMHDALYQKLIPYFNLSDAANE